MDRKPLFSSLGAGASLTIAGVLLLTIVSSVVAFRGWPGLRSEVPTGEAVLAAPAGGDAAPRENARVVLGGGGATARSTASRADRRRARRSRSAAPRTAASPKPTRTLAGAPARKRATAPKSSSRPAGPVVTASPVDAPADDPQPTPNAVEEIVEDTVATVEEAVPDSDGAKSVADDVVGAIDDVLP